MSDLQIIFRASHSGNCLREIVTSIINPEAVKPPEAKLPFLNDGHYLQESVLDFIEQNTGTEFEVKGSEAEGDLPIDGQNILRGHVDALWGEDELLEVKAVMAKTWPRVEADWRQSHPSYRPQAQVYMAFPEYTTARGRTFPGPRKATRFIFKNRDTGEMVGGVEGIRHAAYKFDPKMVERPDERLLRQVVERHKLAAEFVLQGVVPEGCDKQGYCFFCRRQGHGRAPKPRSVYVGWDELMESERAAVSFELSRAEHSLSGLFTRLRADVLEIEMEDGKVRTFNRSDLK